jgi:hypothetical protein
MPRILSYTPDWLSRPKPAFNLFQSKQPESKQRVEGARRTVANRGTEVFVAVGKELRWSDLDILRDAEADGRTSELGQGYRVRYLHMFIHVRASLPKHVLIRPHRSSSYLHLGSSLSSPSHLTAVSSQS